MPIENLKRIRQKLRKLVQKYTVSGILLLPSNGYDKVQVKEANNNIEFLPFFFFVLFRFPTVKLGDGSSMAVNYLFFEQELLQQPAMLILNQETAQKGLNVLSIQGQKAPTEISDMSEGLLSAVLDLPQFNDEERSKISNNTFFLYLRIPCVF